MVSLRSLVSALALALAACHATSQRPVERPRAETAVPLGRGLVSVGPSWVCGQLTHRYFACWGAIADALPWPNELDFDDAAEVMAGANRMCVGDLRGNVRCNDDFQVSDTWHFDLDGRWFCASLRCGGVTCSDGVQTHSVAGLTGYVDQVFVRGDGKAIAMIGDRVYGWELEHESDRPPRASPLHGLDSWQAYVAIRTCTSGPLERCANIHSRSLDGLRELHDVALGTRFGCGLDESGRVACAYFGTEDASVLASNFFAGVVDEVERGVVYSMGDFVAESVDVTTTHACARSAAGEVRCWTGDDGCHIHSAQTCGEVTVEPYYIGVDLRVDPRDVARGEARRYVTPWESGTKPDAEVRLELAPEQFEQLAGGERIVVEAQLVWMLDGGEWVDTRTLRYSLRCRHSNPICR